MTKIFRALPSNGFLAERLRAFFEKQFRYLAPKQVTSLMSFVFPRLSTVYL